MTPAQRVLQELLDEATNRKVNGWISERVRYAQERALAKALRKVQEAEEAAANPPLTQTVVYALRERDPVRRGGDTA